MKESGYPAARAAAVRVHRHYVRHVSATGAEVGGGVETVPHIETIEAIIDVAFWASLRREETYTPRISLAFVEPARVFMPLIFEKPVPLASVALTRLGPAAERPGIHLCISQHQGELLVWGATRNLPQFCFVLEVVGPGLLVMKHSRGDDSGKFINVAVLQGDEIKVVCQDAGATHCPELITSLLGLQSALDSPESVNILLQLAVSMRAHGRGGSLLVVPSGTHHWLESVLQPITYAVSPPFGALMELMKQDVADRSRRRWQESLRRAIDGIAGLTAVDGATILTDQYEVLAFGAKILPRPNYTPVDRIIVTEPIEDSVPVNAEPGQLGGTRHLSGAQFAHDQPDAIALVASQDGRFTVFGWSTPEQVVYGYRIDSLLM